MRPKCKDAHGVEKIGNLAVRRTTTLHPEHSSFSHNAVLSLYSSFPRLKLCLQTPLQPIQFISAFKGFFV